MHLFKLVYIYFLLCLSDLSAKTNDFNPYEVLGLSQTASDREIRQAYKKLARYWHPDKNSEPNAHEQFTKINAAYEVKLKNSFPTKHIDHRLSSLDSLRFHKTTKL